MKKHLIRLFLLMFFLSGCVNTPGSSIPTSVAPTATMPIPPAPTDTPATATAIPSPPTSTFIPASSPKGLIVAYVVEDELWIWKQDQLQLLEQRQNISEPMVSDDGEWLLFRQRHIDGVTPSDELWVIRTDGSELTRLVGSDDLTALADEEGSLLINDIDWLPGRQEILFNTEKIVEGPPGTWPVFDLYSLDLLGNVTRLAEPGQGGNFIPSPNGLHVALMTHSRIGVLDLESGEQRTLLELESVEVPSDSGPSTPKVVWDRQGQFVMTAILPRTLYYPEKYTGEPAQVWRLFVDGQVELIAEVQPFAPAAGVVFSPNLEYFFSLHDSCVDGMGMLTVHNLVSEEHPLLCVWNLPQWIPDSEHFIYELDGLWQLGSISARTNQPLDVLNVPTDPNFHASPPLTWINDEYFLLVLRSRDACTLSVATLAGVITEITSAPADVCPWQVDVSLPK